MPDLKISQLPVATTPLAGTELVPIVQGGTTDQTTVQAIMTSTVPSGTANGVLYLNASKVATSGSALTFDGTTLTNTRNTTDGSAAGLTLNNSGASASYATLNLNAGSVTYQQFADAAGNAIGTAGVMFRTTSNHPLVWGVNGTEQMRLTSTGLGIGTSSPGAKLGVTSPAATAAAAAFRSGSTDSAYLTLGRNAYEAGIGVTGTTVLLTGSSVGDLNIYTNTASGNIRFSAGNTGLIQATLDSSGNLGLGVTPSAWGSIFRAQQIGSNSFLLGRTDGQSQVQLGANAFFNGTNWIYQTSGLGATRYYQNNSSHIWDTAPSGTAGGAISFTQAMTLFASGGLSVGNTTDPGLAGKISAASLALTNGNLIVNLSPQGTAETRLESYNGGATGFLTFYAGNTERARITSTGNVVAGGSVALATNATDGFLYVPTCAGTPTGTPTAITGMAPIVVDTTNNKMYFYSGGAWRDAGP